MKGFQTKVAMVHYQRNYANNGPICSRPTDAIELSAVELTQVPTQVTCKDCVKKLPSVGITPGRVRKLVPRHVGKLSEEERIAQDASTRIHAIRDLREMINEKTPDLLTPEMAIGLFKHWLKDIAHDFRMRNELDEQATVERIIEKL